LKPLFSRARVSVLAAGMLAASLTASATAGAVTRHPSAASRSGWPTSVVLGEVGAANSTSLAPLNALMQHQLGVKLTVTTGMSYAAMIEAQEAGKAQIIAYGPSSHVIVLDKASRSRTSASPPLRPTRTAGTTATASSIPS
jgi:phosphonate transport system substrate-binding protein